jgi:hypothetical protein
VWEWPGRASWRGWRGFGLPSRWSVGDGLGRSERRGACFPIGNASGRAAGCGWFGVRLANCRWVWARCEKLGLPPGPAYSPSGKERGNWLVVGLLLRFGTTG